MTALLRQVRKTVQSSHGLVIAIGLPLLALIQFSGGAKSPFYPLLYLVAAVWGAIARPLLVGLLVLLGVALEIAASLNRGRGVDLASLALHAVFLTAFGLLSAVFTRAELRRLRGASRRLLESQQRRLQDDARSFRLAGALTENVTDDDDKLFRASVEQVRLTLFYELQLLKRSMGLHTCILLLRDQEGDVLRVIEAATGSEALAAGPFSSGEGAVGCAEKRGEMVNLGRLRPGYAGICYYREPAHVRAFLAVPLQDNGQSCGALCADRIEDRPFSQAEEGVLQSAAEHLTRVLENERVFVQLQRSKREQTILHKASQALGAALDEAAVLDAALEAANGIAPFDFAAVTQYDPVNDRHSIRRAVGEGAEALANLSFRDNASLTAMAVKNRHYLPYRGELRGGEQMVYTRKADLVGMGSLLVLPLLVRESAIGTLALGTRRRDAFGPAVRPALQVLSNQLAVALSNAALVAKLEEQATTDALTGCSNRRAFQEEFDLKLRAAERFGRRVSLVLTDLDHFKSVNDTYGHTVGDVVLKELGQILRRVKRETDLVARFGGEEFCLVCEETDTTGAVRLAERVREELGGTVFHTDLGKLKVTCSAGVATYPDDARDRQMLFEIADRAMYAAKQAGRNRVLAGLTPA
jgi:diguanylate cyclase (GGDEF)-like protein